MKTKNRWQRNRANGEFWLAWASDDNRLHTIGAKYYSLCIAWNNWRIKRMSADEWNNRNRIS